MFTNPSLLMHDRGISVLKTIKPYSNLQYLFNRSALPSLFGPIISLAFSLHLLSPRNLKLLLGGKSQVT